MIGSVFADSLIEIISKTSGLSVSEIHEEENENNLYGLTGMMNLNGKNSGIVFISAREDDMRFFCSRMTGEDRNKLTSNDLSDAICELVNMTAGSAKLRLGHMGYSFTLSPPLAMESGYIKLITKKRMSVVSLILGNDKLKFKVKIIMHAAEKE